MTDELDEYDDDDEIEDEDERPTTEELFYGGTKSVVSSIEPAIKADVDRLQDAQGWAPEERSEYVADFAHAVHDARIDPTRAATVHALLTQYTINPPDEATVEGWEVASRKLLRERHGVEEATRRLDLAREFIEARPALAQRFHGSGLGSHPQLIEALTEQPHMLRIKPRPRRD